MTVVGPGICEKRGSFQTSTARYQKPRKRAKPSSIRYGRGLRSHCERRYAVISKRFARQGSSAMAAVEALLNPTLISVAGRIASGRVLSRSQRNDARSAPEWRMKLAAGPEHWRS